MITLDKCAIGVKYIVMEIVNFDPRGLEIFFSFNIKKNSIITLENKSLFGLLLKASVSSEVDYISFMIHKKDAKNILVQKYE